MGKQKGQDDSAAFDKALKRLVGVPKEEVDKEEAKWQRMRERAAQKREAKGKKRR